MIGAATLSFGERGYRASSLKAIGERAGISHGVIPFHFGSKEGLLLAVVDHCFEVFQRSVFGALAGRTRDFSLGDLRAFVEAQLTFQQERPEVGRLFQVLMFEALGPSPELRAHFQSFHARLKTRGAGWIRAGQEAGTIRRELDADATVDMLLCFSTGLRTHSLLLEGEAIDRRHVHEQMLELLTRSVRPEGEPR